MCSKAAHVQASGKAERREKREQKEEEEKRGEERSEIRKRCKGKEKKGRREGRGRDRQTDRWIHREMSGSFKGTLKEKTCILQLAPTPEVSITSLQYHDMRTKPSMRKLLRTFKIHNGAQTGVGLCGGDLRSFSRWLPFLSLAT